MQPTNTSNIHSTLGNIEDGVEARTSYATFPQLKLMPSVESNASYATSASSNSTNTPLKPGISPIKTNTIYSNRSNKTSPFKTPLIVETPHTTMRNYFQNHINSQLTDANSNNSNSSSNGYDSYDNDSSPNNNNNNDDHNNNRIGNTNNGNKTNSNDSNQYASNLTPITQGLPYGYDLSTFDKTHSSNENNNSENLRIASNINTRRYPIRTSDYIAALEHSDTTSSLHLGTPRTCRTPINDNDDNNDNNMTDNNKNGRSNPNSNENKKREESSSSEDESTDSNISTDSDFDDDNDNNNYKGRKKKKEKNRFQFWVNAKKKHKKKRKKKKNNINESDKSNDDIIVMSTSKIGAIFNFVNTALGGALGLMGNIFAASKLGIFNFLFFSGISAICTYFSIEFLCRSSELSQKFSTHNLAKQHFGSHGSILTKFFIFIGNWGFIVNILQIFADFAPQILNSWINNDDNPHLIKRWHVVLIGLIIIFPWVLVKSISKLEKLSALCIILSLFIFGVLIGNGLESIVKNEVNSTANIFVTNAYDIFLGLPTVAWCWSLQYNALPIYLTLHPMKRVSQIGSISRWSVIIIYLMYGLQGIAVYVAWGTSINEDFITNLDSTDKNYEHFYFNKWVSTLTQFIICIACFAAIPIFAFESRTNLHAIIMSLFRSYTIKKIDATKGIYNTSTNNNKNNNNVNTQNNNNYKYENISGHSGAEDITHLNSNSENNDDESVSGGTKIQKQNDNYTELNNDNKTKNNIMDNNNNNDNKNDLMDIDDIDFEIETRKSRWIEGTFICISACLVALEVKNLNLMLTLAGATYGCYIMFFLPSLVYIKSINYTKQRRDIDTFETFLTYFAYAMIIMGTIICVAGVTTALM